MKLFVFLIPIGNSKFILLQLIKILKSLNKMLKKSF